MLYAIAIEPGDEQHALGVVVPDLPGCFSAGDTLEEAIANAREAIELHLEGLSEDGAEFPVPLGIEHHRANPEFQGWRWEEVGVDVVRAVRDRRRTAGAARYPAVFEPAPEGGFVVTFRDIPEAITQGDDEAGAMAMAEDALATSMEFYFEDRRPVPPPSAPKEGERLVELPGALWEKVQRLNAELARGRDRRAAPSTAPGNE